MALVYVTGNNYGNNYNNWWLKIYESRSYMVLSGSLSVNPFTTKYGRASVLEVEFDHLPFDSSAPVAVYVKAKPHDQEYITIVKSWIKDNNTICFEKVKGWESVGFYEIIIQSIYVRLGYDFRPTSYRRTVVSLVDPPEGVSLFVENCTFEAEWAFMYMQFRQLRLEDPTQPLTLNLRGLPNKSIGFFRLIYNDPSLELYGSGSMLINVNGNLITSASAFGEVANNAVGRKFFKGAIVF